MSIQIRLAAALFTAASLFAQTPAPPAAASPSPAQAPAAAPKVAAPQVQGQRSKAFVRRFSIGPTLAVLPLPTMPNGDASKLVANPAFDGLYSTAGTIHRVSYGVTGQLAITERFAAAVGLFVRRAAYRMNSDVYLGVDNPTTLIDERKHTVTNEDTRARFYDLPVTVRYYGKDRHVKGPRWYVEGGAAFRKVSNIKTSIDTTVGTGTTQCCDTKPVQPANKMVRGMVAGAGVQLIDPIGIRVVPGVRYTRWTSEIFNNQSTTMQKNQVEATISLTF